MIVCLDLKRNHSLLIGNALARQQSLGLSQHQLSPRDVRRVMRFEQQRPPPHRLNPLVGQVGRIQKPARSLNPRQPGGHWIRDGEAGNEGHGRFRKFNSGVARTNPIMSSSRVSIRPIPNPPP
jgi:hypothetical protein